MFFATAMLFILDALFVDIDLDFIGVVLHNLLSFIAFGAVTLGLAYGFHHNATVWYISSLVYSSPTFVPTVNVHPHHSEPALLTINHPQQAAEPRHVQMPCMGAYGSEHSHPPTDTFCNTTSRQETPLQNAAPPYCLPHLAPMAMALRRKTLARERRSGRAYTEYVAPVPPTVPAPIVSINPAFHVTPPGPTNATNTLSPPAQPTFSQLRETASTFLLSTTTSLLTVDASRHYHLAPDSEYWNVVDKATGLTIGIIDQAGHLAHAISTVQKIGAQANMDWYIKRTVTTLRTYSFDLLPRNSNGNYTNTTLASQVTYLDVRNLDETHSSLIAQDSRLCKVPPLSLPLSGFERVLGLFAFDNTTTSATAISNGPSLTAFTPSSPTSAPVPANPEIVVVAPELVDFDMVDAASPSLDDNAMVIGDSNLTDDVEDDDAMVIDDSDLADAMIDTDSDFDIDMTEAPPVIAPTIITSIITFPHTGLTIQEKAKALTTTAAPDTSDQFDGPCTVSWDGPSGRLESGALTLELRRFLDEELMVPMNDPVYSFKQMDGTFVGSFTVLKGSPSFRSGDGTTTFPFQFQGVGPEESQEVVDLEITMTAAVADEFSLLTGAALPAQ
ncbi:hypothetical protein FRB98_001513 [Tulasnella sp. 332]|nr:hypothetical protein FRB98_001513 [Tulasnella sp. 332]